MRRGSMRAGLVVAVMLLLAAMAPAQEAAPAPYRILVTNDDGIDAPGLAALVEALAPLGELSIVAPLENQSGTGHALTLSDPIYLARRSVAGRDATGVAATPAACVRVALGFLLRETKPDLVVSGINRGLNFGRNAYISGTVAAAREAALQGLPAIAVSLAIEAHPRYDAAAAAAARVVEGVREGGLPEGIFLNVSVPADEPPRGLKVAGQSRLFGRERYEEGRTLYGRRYLWGMFEQPSEGAEEGSDVAAVLEGYVAVTPLRADESADALLESLRQRFD